MNVCLGNCLDKFDPEESVNKQIEFENTMIDLRFSSWHNQHAVDKILVKLEYLANAIKKF